MEGNVAKDDLGVIYPEAMEGIHFGMVDNGRKDGRLKFVCSLRGCHNPMKAYLTNDQLNSHYRQHPLEWRVQISESLKPRWRWLRGSGQSPEKVTSDDEVINGVAMMQATVAKIFSENEDATSSQRERLGKRKSVTHPSSTTNSRHRRRAILRQKRRTMQVLNKTLAPEPSESRQHYQEAQMCSKGADEARELQATEAPGEAEDLQPGEACQEGSESRRLLQGPECSKGADEAHALQATEAAGGAGVEDPAETEVAGWRNFENLRRPCEQTDEENFRVRITTLTALSKSASAEAAQAQVRMREKITRVLRAAQIQLKAFKRDVFQAEIDNQKAETELATSMKEREGALAAAQDARHNCDAFQLEVEQLRKVIESQDRDLDSVTRRCDDATNEAEELRLQMQKQKERFESDRDSLKRERDQLKEDNALQLQNVESIKRDRDKAKHEAAELGDKMINSRSQLEAVEKKLFEQLQQTKEAQKAMDTYRRTEQLKESSMKDTLDEVARLRSALSDHVALRT